MEQIVNGKKWGKLYNFSTTSGDEITGTTLKGSESEGVFYPNSAIREPDIVSAYDIDSRLQRVKLGAESGHEFLMQMEKEFNKSMDSIEKYGGFYIGRYETGGLSSTAVVVKGNTNIVNQTWYTLYLKNRNLSGTNENVTTRMIWGCEWDRTLMWLIESGNKTKEQICEDSGSWGNYLNNSITYINSSGNEVTTSTAGYTLIPAGSSEQTKANNIYDLAGNAREWTMEAISNYSRQTRGGSAKQQNGTSNYRPNDAGIPINTYNGYMFGTRAVLYIK